MHTTWQCTWALRHHAGERRPLDHRDPSSFRTLARYPDLFIAFGVDPVAYKNSNGYIISEQGKPPDFVLEIASPSTAAVDVGIKREDYAALASRILAVRRDWELHGARLAGDRLVGDIYVPIDLEELPDGSLQGYSAVLNLNLRWENGQLGWYDPTPRPPHFYVRKRTRPRRP